MINIHFSQKSISKIKIKHKNKTKMASDKTKTIHNELGTKSHGIWSQRDFVTIQQNRRKEQISKISFDF